MGKHLSLLACACAVPLMWVMGCPRAEQPAPTAPASVQDPVTVEAPAATSSSSSSPSRAPASATDAPAASAPQPAPIEPQWRGDYCKSDADCGWNDPCRPQRCGTAPRSPVPCDKSAPPPGTCSCIENMCTLRPDDLSRGDTHVPSCLRDEDCAVDVGTGQCHAKGQSLIGPIHREGPVCVCKPSMGSCALEWVDPIPCESWRDCSWVRHPRLRPVPAKQVPRPIPRKVRPCQDGEFDSVCEADGNKKLCRVVGWSC